MIQEKKKEITISTTLSTMKKKQISRKKKKSKKPPYRQRKKQQVLRFFFFIFYNFFCFCLASTAISYHQLRITLRIFLLCLFMHASLIFSRDSWDDKMCPYMMEFQEACSAPVVFLFSCPNFHSRQ